ncbi:hypothetical protein [Serratia marcescens]|uniref:FidL-like membrane protein n=1 Tax=Serratia marcescens TaxID=615 RepID=A0ABD6HS51_SERMA|nr:hypothetical protein [Serratia marcescens]MDT0204228.1 hypothetical protein [Serratia marcescens]MVF04952.1 hypothetical protein [Serratia marcescens]
MKKIKPLILAVSVTFAVFFIFVICFFFHAGDDDLFECQAHLRLDMAANTCQGKSSFYFFLSMHGGGKGYFIINGSYTCPNDKPIVVDEIVNFNHKKEGSYNTIILKPRTPELVTLFAVLKYNVIKLKIMPLDAGRVYLLSVPLRSPMVCRRIGKLEG